jgi:hypothetical protein
MATLLGFFQLIGGAAVLIVVLGVLAAPQLLAGIAAERRDKGERELLQQDEIARKVAIAEAAMEARKRGEAFVPPADYDR